VNRDTGNVLLILVGGAVLRISIGDTFLRYVRGGLHLPLLLAGATLVLIGLVSLWRENPGRRPVAGEDLADTAEADETRGQFGEELGGVAQTSGTEALTEGQPAAVTGSSLLTEPVNAGYGEPVSGGAGHGGSARDGTGHGDGAPGHDHAHGNRVAWLLLLPVFAIFLIAPPALGSYAANRSTITRVPPATSDYPPLPAGDPLQMRLDEYEARAVWDGGRNMSDRTFRLIGFVTERPGGGYYLTRMVISCCAADATAARILVTGSAGSYPSDTWIQVTGHYDGLDRSREKQVGPVAIIRADSVQQIPAPREPYET
jgi:uncharacterized repeat protein (TIGR03943 family)